MAGQDVEKIGVAQHVVVLILLPIHTNSHTGRRMNGESMKYEN